MTSYRALIQRRWTDLDAQQHINNTLFADYLQEARTQFLTESDATTQLMVDGCIVVWHRVEYKRPLGYSTDPVAVDCSIAELGAARFVIDYLLHGDDGQVACHCQTLLCPYDFEASYPRRLSSTERRYLTPFCSEPSTLPPVTMHDLNGAGVIFPIAPRWSDEDRYSHINNVRYFDWVQQARIEAMVQADPSTARVGMPQWLPGSGEHGFTWLLVRQDINYLSQLKHRIEPYQVHTAITRMGTSSVELTHEVVDPGSDGLVAARACAILICADQQGRPTPLTEETRSRLSSLLVDPA